MLLTKLFRVQSTKNLICASDIKKSGNVKKVEYNAIPLFPKKNGKTNNSKSKVTA